MAGRQAEHHALQLGHVERGRRALAAHVGQHQVDLPGLEERRTRSDVVRVHDRALEGLRDLSTLQWYVIPLLAIVFYIYTFEIGKARRTGNWNAVIAGAANVLALGALGWRY